jgi:hypothetical protein
LRGAPDDDTQGASTRGAAIWALGAIVLGILFLIASNALSGLQALAIVISAISGGLLARFILNGRREPGLALIGFASLFLLVCCAIVANGLVTLPQGWPLFVGAVGLALTAVFIFTAPRDRGVFLAGVTLIWASGVALAFTLDFFSWRFLAGFAVFWPIVLLVPIVLLLPRIFRSD